MKISQIFKQDCSFLEFAVYIIMIFYLFCEILSSLYLFPLIVNFLLVGIITTYFFKNMVKWKPNQKENESKTLNT